jgi:hypothetical protein
MLRKRLLVGAMTVGLVLAGSGTAYAWDLIASKSGDDLVTLRAWTRNYNQVAFVADHAGTRVDVKIVVDCRNGYHFDDTWIDGGERFRFILGGLGNSGRCNHTFRVDGRSATAELDLTIYARG